MHEYISYIYINILIAIKKVSISFVFFKKDSAERQVICLWIHLKMEIKHRNKSEQTLIKILT